MEKFFCERCGFSNPIENQFCNKCGSTLNKTIESEFKIPLIKESIIDFSGANYMNLEFELMNLLKKGGILIVKTEDHGIKFSIDQDDMQIDLGEMSHFDNSLQISLQNLNYTSSDGYLIKMLNISYVKSNIDKIINEFKVIFLDLYKFRSEKPFVFENFEEPSITAKLTTTPTTEKKSDILKTGWFAIGIIALILFYHYVINPPQKSGFDHMTTSENVSNIVNVGETLSSDMFDITVNKVSISNNVNVGNEFLNLKEENGNSYLVFNVTFKNVDKESRTLIDGDVMINFNGKDYLFDKSETILDDGWGLFLEQINPLTSKTTNLVYKIPSDLKGQMFWHPGRTNDNQKILLGELQ